MVEGLASLTQNSTPKLWLSDRVSPELANSGIELSRDPNPELEKHPMSLEASQSSRESTRYPLGIKPGPGGNPPGGVWSLEN